MRAAVLAAFGLAPFSCYPDLQVTEWEAIRGTASKGTQKNTYFLQNYFFKPH